MHYETAATRQRKFDRTATREIPRAPAAPEGRGWVLVTVMDDPRSASPDPAVPSDVIDHHIICYWQRVAVSVDVRIELDGPTVAERILSGRMGEPG